MGAGGGAIWHFAKGMKNSPKGARFGGGIEVRDPVPEARRRDISPPHDLGRKAPRYRRVSTQRAEEPWFGRTHGDVGFMSVPRLRALSCPPERSHVR
jgi:hypothetical protein